MIPKRVTLKNFLSFGDNEQVFDFTDEESLWILTGPNGVGKSAVFDAITYCLFLQHRGGKSDFGNLIRHGANGFRVSFEFEFNGVDYRVTRTRGSNATQRAERKDATGEWSAIATSKDDIEEWVEETLGLRFESFTASVLLRQGEADAIVEATGTRRMEILKRIIDVERFEALSNRIAQALRVRSLALDQARQQRGNAVEVTPEQVETARAAFQAAEEEQDNAQGALLASSKAVEQAKKRAELETNRRGLDGKLAEADERAKHREQIRTEHARFTTLTSVLPVLQDIAAAQDRFDKAEGKHAEDAAALAKLNEILTGTVTALETATQSSAEHRAAKEEHDREASRLKEEVTREEKFLETAEKVRTLKEARNGFPADLDALLEASRTASKSADGKIEAATEAAGKAKSIAESISKLEEEFEKVGAVCSKCRQPVKPEFAAEEKARLRGAAEQARAELEATRTALGDAKNRKQAASAESIRLAKDASNRDKVVNELAIHEKTLEDIGLDSDPAKLKAELDGKRSAVQVHQAKFAEAERQMKAAAAESTRLETAKYKRTDERDEISKRVQGLLSELASARAERDTLFKQLTPEWQGTVDRDALAKEQQKLAASGIAERFATLLSDSESQIQRKALRDAILAELQGLPATSVAEADELHSAAMNRSTKANGARDEARTALDQLEASIDAFQKLIAAVEVAEIAHDRHRKLNDWLGKYGLLRELVREAECEIVRYAQDTLRSLSNSELEIALSDEPRSDDEALVLVVRRQGDPVPTPVKFLSGSQKFRVAVAIAVAIGKFAAGPAAARPLESVIIDEGFGSLDKDGLRAMRDELENLKNSQALKRVILVSHQEEFTDTFPVGYRLAPGENGTIATPFRHDA